MAKEAKGERIMAQMMQEAILKAKGQTVKEVLAHDPYGYDRGFTLEFESGLILEVLPASYKVGQDLAKRLRVKEGS